MTRISELTLLGRRNLSSLLTALWSGDIVAWSIVGAVVAFFVFVELYSRKKKADDT